MDVDEEVPALARTGAGRHELQDGMQLARLEYGIGVVGSSLHFPPKSSALLPMPAM